MGETLQRLFIGWPLTSCNWNLVGLCIGSPVWKKKTESKTRNDPLKSKSFVPNEFDHLPDFYKENGRTHTDGTHYRVLRVNLMLVHGTLLC